MAEPSAASSKAPSMNHSTTSANKEEKSGGSGGCTFDRGTPARRYGDIAAPDRLSFPRGSKTDRLYVNTPKPNGLVPVKFLPIWPELHTDAKIPVLPAPKDTFEISRGQVGTDLHRPVVDFTLVDPLNHEMVVTSPYTALHDSHAKALFVNPPILDHVKKMMLVYPDGEVRCNTNEFNEYRRYLSKRIYLADLNGNYVNAEKIQAIQKNQIKEIQKDVSKTEGKVFKNLQTQLRAKELQTKKMFNLRQRFLLKNAYTDFRSQAHVQMLAEAQANRLLASVAKESQVKTKVAMVREENENRRKFYVRKILEKEQRTEEYIKSEKCRKAKEHEEFLTDWLSVRCEAQKRQIEKATEVKKTVNATLKKRAMRRQMKVDAHRAGMVERIEARAAEEARIWALVKKYFYRWLDNVRKRKARRPDEFHRSFWPVQAEVETAVAYLRQESGYEKFDDFIMNIVKLKRDIMAEIESEEQAEAAAALGLAKFDADDELEPLNDDETAQAEPPTEEQPPPPPPPADGEQGQGSTVAPPSAVPPVEPVKTETSIPAAPESDGKE